MKSVFLRSHVVRDLARNRQCDVTTRETPNMQAPAFAYGDSVSIDYRAVYGSIIYGVSALNRYEWVYVLCEWCNMQVTPGQPATSPADKSASLNVRIDFARLSLLPTLHCKFQ